MKKYIVEPVELFKNVTVGHIAFRIAIEMVSCEPEVRVIYAGSNEIIEYCPTREALNSVVYGMVMAYSSVGIRLYIEDNTDLVNPVDTWRKIC